MSSVALQTSKHRLPSTVVPSFYDIRVTPDIAAGTFEGEQTVALIVAEPTSEIVLNAAELVISDVVITDDDGTSLTATVEHDEESQRATFRFNGTAGIGHWDLKLKFKGILNDKLKGFYRSTYTRPDGTEATIATTKFEPCDARRAFPCWDEPAFKARFKISLVIDAHLQAVCNAALLSEKPMPGGKKLLEFAPSIKMSSYLVAYVVGELEASDPVMADGVEIRVWAVPGKKHLAPFALEIAKYSLEYFARYFQQPYPANKLDLIAIPDFASGAMENFACITFRETALLVDPATASVGELKRVAEVVAHENAHMWFGDMATMEWWNSLWLNEAFATFMASKAVDEWKPEWKVWEDFSIDRAGALRVDGLHSTRTIEFPVGHPDEARAMFDVLTYQKGAAVLRMLELYIGEEPFRKGIVHFLEDHKFGNADTPALWEALEPFAGEILESAVNIPKLMNGWVFQAGYPVVSVAESAVSGSIVLQQKPFKYLPGASETILWDVPIAVRAQTRDGVVEKMLCLSAEKETVYLGEELGWIVVNSGGGGFFRVNYSQKLREKLVANVNALSATERFNLVNDLWATVQSGEIDLPSYIDALDTLIVANGETDPNVYTIVVGSLNTIRRLISRDGSQDAVVLKLAQRLLNPALARLGFAGQAQETTQQAQLRATLVGTLGALGDEPVLKWAREQFALLKREKAAVDGNLAGPVVNTVAGGGDSALYEELLSLRNSAGTPQEQIRYLYALASFKDKALLQRTLDLCLTSSVRTQDAPTLIRSVLVNPYGSDLAWRFIQENWEKMSSLYPPSGMKNMCEGVTTLVDERLADEASSFFQTHSVPGGDKTIAQYLEMLRVAVRLKSRETANINKLLVQA